MAQTGFRSRGQGRSLGISWRSHGKSKPLRMSHSPGTGPSWSMEGGEGGGRVPLRAPWNHLRPHRGHGPPLHCIREACSYCV